ncbi:hypothetical protein K439DRAFT_1356148 [Ramaria rubella]|nr:hypothetical protein K439DRAFT_1356148 [Ramaria rubella]
MEVHSPNFKLYILRLRHKSIIVKPSATDSHSNQLDSSAQSTIQSVIVPSASSPAHCVTDSQLLFPHAYATPPTSRPIRECRAYDRNAQYLHKVQEHSETYQKPKGLVAKPPASTTHDESSHPESSDVTAFTRLEDVYCGFTREGNPPEALPKNILEAMSGKNSRHWKPSIECELKGFVENDVYDVVKIPDRTIPILSHPVFKIK